jgi:uncharacterized protein (TIGR02996 family)
MPATAATNRERPFILAVAARPQDPLPKLMFADWLLDEGDPAAAVMRWCGERNKYPRPVGRFHGWNSHRWPSQGEDLAGPVLPWALFSRIDGRQAAWSDVRHSIETRPIGYSSYRCLATIADCFNALLAAARRCAVDGVDPMGE